jgi:hypothetical protein
VFDSAKPEPVSYVCYAVRRKIHHVRVRRITSGTWLERRRNSLRNTGLEETADVLFSRSFFRVLKLRPTAGRPIRLQRKATASFAKTTIRIARFQAGRKEV